MIKEKDSHGITDQLLLQQMKEDNYTAFDAIYERYWEQIYNSAYKRLKDEDFAKDITQDIFLQLWQRRTELVIHHLPSYLHTSVRNNVLKYLEKEQKYTPISALLEQLLAAKDETDAALIRKEFLVRYEALINTLTPSQQEIFRLRYHDDLTTLDIAEKLNISRKTVQNQLTRSVAQLRQSIGILAFIIFSNP